jgi:hypothetical protein
MLRTKKNITELAFSKNIIVKKRFSALVFANTSILVLKNELLIF